MAGEMLSQEEINALLGGINFDEDITGYDKLNESLTPEQVDALGEIGNISMGTAATTLFALLNHKVLITTPQVEVLTIEKFRSIITEDLIAISVDYTEGLTGSNVLILNEKDVKVIADLMMGGSGICTDEPISEFHLSAISEAMNQMIGSASTSMSQMFEKKIDISPPQAVQLKNIKDHLDMILPTDDQVVKISFRMQILENIIDSELMQVIPARFAKELVNYLLEGKYRVETNRVVEERTMNTQVLTPPPVGNYSAPNPTSSMVNQSQIEVQNPQFPQFDKQVSTQPVGNMDVLMDVALEVSVELGRTKKRIKDILEFGPGTVIELDHLVGEPIDILVNGKYIAKGEVVVIDESFGVRITDIIKPENRI